MRRCEARAPDDGSQCGDYAGHDGDHTKLIDSEFLRVPSGEPDYATAEARGDNVIRSETMLVADGAVMVRYAVMSHSLAFDAKEIVAYAEGDLSRPEFEYFDHEGRQEFTPEFERGDRFVEGCIKWDGCAHVNFGDENGYLHLCGFKYAQRVGDVLRAAFEYAAAHVPAFDHSCADMPTRSAE